MCMYPCHGTYVGVIDQHEGVRSLGLVASAFIHRAILLAQFTIFINHIKFTF